MTMKKFFVAMATAVIMMMVVMPVKAFAAETVTININGNNNSVVIYEDYNGDVQQHDATPLSNIPSDARTVYVWAQGEQRATGYLVNEEVYLASYDDVKKVFPNETRTWAQVTTDGATPLFMWCDSFGYTYKIEANNVFLFQAGIANNSGETITAKPYPIYIDGYHVSGIYVYLSDEDATVYAGKDELSKIFSTNIVCTEVAHYTVNYWAEHFGYDMFIEQTFVNLVKKPQSTPPAVTPATNTTTNTNVTPVVTNPSVTNPTTTTSTSTATTTEYVSKSYTVMVENKLTTYVAKTKMSNGKEIVYLPKSYANKILKAYGKKTVSKAIEVTTLAKKCGVVCKVKGSYVYLNKSSNTGTEIRLNEKVINTKTTIIQNKKDTIFVSADILKKLGMKVTYNKESGNVTVVKGSEVMQFTKGSKTYYNVKGASCKMSVAPYVKSNKIMLPLVTIARGFGYTVYSEFEPGFTSVSISK